MAPPAVSGYPLEAKCCGRSAEKTTRKEIRQLPSGYETTNLRQGGLPGFSRARHTSVRTTHRATAALQYPQFMTTPLTLSSSKLARLFALAGIALSMQAPLVRAQNRVNEHSFDAVVALDRTKPLKLLQRAKQPSVRTFWDLGMAWKSNCSTYPS